MDAASQINPGATRAVSLTREGGFFRLTFPYDASLVALARSLPYASFDGETRAWSARVCVQSLDTLRAAHRRGVVDVDPDSLLDPGEEPVSIRPAMLRAGTVRRPFIVSMATRDDTLYSRLIGVPGARWDKTASAVSYPATAAAALGELVERGVVDDPQGILTPAAVTITFDTRVGKFSLRGDERAARVFHEHFPARDVVTQWQEKGLDVGFADPFSEEVYRGEIARCGEGVQPAGMALPLYGYQSQDVAVALERSGLLVAHSMGVGKTLIAIATGHELVVNRAEVPRVVVVVPAAVRTQWRNEIIRFTGCDPSDVVVVDGDKKKRMAAYDAADAGAKWVIVHYQAVILPDDKKRLDKLVRGAFLVADECHRVKNHQAKSTKVLQEFAKKSARRLGLSGTPVENNPGEWYNILSGFVTPGVFGSPTEFLNRYSYASRWGGFEGARNLPELRERSKPLYIRRTLSQVASHLPRQRVQTIVLEPRPEYAAALRRAHREARDEIAKQRLEDAKKRTVVLDGYEREEVEAGAEMTAVGLLKLLCSSPQLIVQSDAPSAQVMVESGLIPDEDGPKLDEVRTMAAELAANGDRVVVFSASKRMAYLLAERLSTDGIRHVLFTGDSSASERDEAVDAFTTPGTPDDPGPTVFIATDAGAEGLNLGRCCSTLVNLDIPWTPGRLAQRNARVRRVDSEQTSFLVVNLVLAGTIELGILRMIEHKADLVDAVLGESGGRRATTGRGGRNVFETALAEWSES
jgi:superfamily II DNA or RNA helicase